MIELDEEVKIVPIATCLDRAKVALEQTGQHHCAMICYKLQEAISEIAEDFGLNPNKPVEIVRWLISVQREGHLGRSEEDRRIWFMEAMR